MYNCGVQVLYSYGCFELTHVLALAMKQNTHVNLTLNGYEL